MRRTVSGCILLAASLLTACDNNSNTAPPPPATQPIDTSTTGIPPVPSAETLLKGPRKKLDVKFAPITLQVPDSWDLTSLNDGAVVLLKGPTPTRQVAVSIPISRSITADQEKVLEADAEKCRLKYPPLLQSPMVRDINGARVIEQFLVDDPIATTETDTDSTASSQPTTIQTVLWTFTVCVPSEIGFTAYDLRMGLTLPQYKADQAFLRSIIDSMTYTPNPDLEIK